MTTDLNSQQYIKHDVPDDACNGAKLLADIFNILRKEVLNNRWECITIDDILLNYNTNSEITEITITHRDANRHLHRFKMQFSPSDGCKDDTHEDIFTLRYSFEGNFNENSQKTRSFVHYLSDHLIFAGLEVLPTLHPYIEKNFDNKYIVKYTEDLIIHCDIEDVYKSFCTLLDITLSKLKPLSWFYTPEPVLKGLDEAYYYMNNICALLQIQSSKGRWEGVTPDCFKVERYNGEVLCELSFIVKDVWELCLFAFIADCKDYYDMCCSFFCHPNAGLSDNIKDQLYRLFGEFLTTLECANGNTYLVGRNVENQSVQLQYFYIEDTFDIFCSMIDEIVPKVQSYKFHIPDQQAELTEEIVAVKTQMEKALSTQFHVVTEAEEVNNKLKHGYFKS